MMLHLEDLGKKNKDSLKLQSRVQFARASFILRSSELCCTDKVPDNEAFSLSEPFLHWTTLARFPARIENFFLFSLKYPIWVENLHGPRAYIFKLLQLKKTPPLSHPKYWEFLWERFCKLLCKSTTLKLDLFFLFVEAPWRGIQGGGFKNDEGERWVVSKTIAILMLSCNWGRFCESL